MTTSISPPGIKAPRSLVEGLFIGRPQYAGLYGSRLVCLVDRQHLVHMGTHHQRHPTLSRLQPQGHRGTAAIHIDGKLLLIAIFDYLLHILFASGMKDDIRGLAHNLPPEVHNFIDCLAVAVLDPAVIIGRYVLFSDNFNKLPYLLIIQLNLLVYNNPLIAFILLMLKILIGHAEFVFHHRIPCPAGVLEFMGIAPFKD